VGCILRIKRIRTQNFSFESTNLKILVRHESHSRVSCLISGPLMYYDNILKNCKMHERWGLPFFCPMNKKKISPHIKWCFGKCSELSTIFFKTSIWHLEFMLYHAVIFVLGIFEVFPMFMPKLCSGGFKVRKRYHSVFGFFECKFYHTVECC